MRLVLTHVENEPKEFRDFKGFILFVQELYNENEECTELEDLPIIPNTKLEAIEYIQKYCGSFKFEEIK